MSRRDRTRPVRPAAASAGRRRHPAVAREPRRPDGAVLRVHPADRPRDRPARARRASRSPPCTSAPARSPSPATSRPRGRARGSRCVELEQDLVDFVREHLPWSQRRAIRVRYGDARAVLGRFPPRPAPAAVDLLVVDIFGGARTPAHVTSIEFYREARRAPRARRRARRERRRRPRRSPSPAARPRPSLRRSATSPLLAETQILKGRRFGNVVLVGSAQPLPLDFMPRLLAGGPHPAKVVAGRELRQFIAGAPVVTDATAVPSPPPAQSIFQVARRRVASTGDGPSCRHPARRSRSSLGRCTRPRSRARGSREPQPRPPARELLPTPTPTDGTPTGVPHRRERPVASPTGLDVALVDPPHSATTATASRSSASATPARSWS